MWSEQRNRRLSPGRGGCQHHNVGAISSDGLLWHKLLIGLYNSEWLISSLDDGDERFVPGEKRGQVGRNGVYNYMGCLTVPFCSQSGLLPIPGWCHFSFHFTLSSIEEWISSGKWDTHTHTHTHTRMHTFLCFAFLLFSLLVVSTLQITLLLCAQVETFVGEIPAFTQYSGGECNFIA